MIEYGSNGKMNGLWILTRLMTEGFVSFAADDMVYAHGRHKLTGVKFSEKVKEIPELSLNFSEVVENFMYLCHYVEKDRKLRVEAEQLTEEILQENNGEAITGLSFLACFVRGKIRVWEVKAHCIELMADGFLYDHIPGFKEKMERLLHTVLGYSGDDRPFITRVIRKDYFRTEYVYDGLSVTFSVNDMLEKAIREDREYSDTIAAEAAPLKDPREEAVERNVNSTLSILAKQFDEIEKNKQEAMEDTVGFRLSYKQNLQYRTASFTVDIPDGFSYVTDTDGCEFIMWLPNGENPEVWEASSMLMTSEKEDGESVFSVSITHGGKDEAEALKLREELLSHVHFSK